MVQKICGSFISPAMGDNDKLLPQRAIQVQRSIRDVTGQYCCYIRDRE